MLIDSSFATDRVRDHRRDHEAGPADAVDDPADGDREQSRKDRERRLDQADLEGRRAEVEGAVGHRRSGRVNDRHREARDEHLDRKTALPIPARPGRGRVGHVRRAARPEPGPGRRRTLPYTGELVAKELER